MAADASGVLDTRSALDRDAALLRAGETLPATQVIVSLDGAAMALPYAVDGIEKVVDSAYRVGGFAALTMIHDAAAASFAALQRGSTFEAGAIAGRVREREDLVKTAQDMLPESGDTTAAQALLAQRRAARDLYKDAMPAALAQLEAERARRMQQLADLRAAIDRVAEVEEVAQRWYEGKLMASIAADFQKRQQDLEQAWRAYRIGDTQTKLTVLLKDTTSSDGLAIFADNDTAVTVGKPSATIQGEKMDVPVPTVVKATFELAHAQYEYQQAFGAATKAAALRRAPVDPRNLPAWQQREKYASLVGQWGEQHFIALAAHRGLVTTTRDIGGAFDRKRYDTAIIDAFLAARDAMPQLLLDMRSNVLFQDAEPVAVTDLPALARPAAEVLIAARYGDRADAGLEQRKPSATAAAQSARTAGRDEGVPDIYRSPWEQKPFGDRLLRLADVLRIEEQQVDAQAAAPPAVVDPTNANPAAASRNATVDREAFAKMQREVAHLRPLFAERSDRKKLLWCMSTGTLMARARLEVSERLEERIDKLAKMRAAIQLTVAATGVILIPFTGGQSLIVAGAVDALLVADRTVDEVEKWVAAEQFSHAVLDELASMHWTQPEVAMLVGQLLEAGYAIAGDLLQVGVAGKIFDMIGVADLGVTLVDTSLEMLQRARL